MSRPNFCNRCGNPAQPEANFCPFCGNTLAPSAYPSSTTTSQINSTKTGLLLLILGIILLVIPLIGVIGGLLNLVGAIMVIIGRDAFGAKHSKYVVTSVVIYLLGSIASGVVTFGFIFAIFSDLSNIGPSNPAAFAQAVSAALSQYIPALLVIGAISGLSYVLFTYAIQNSTGRILLWTAYALTMIVNIVIFSQMSSTLSELFNQSFANSPTSNPGQFLALETQLYSYTLFDAIPFAFYVAAYFLLWRRIKQGELPSQQASSSLGRPPTS